MCEEVAGGIPPLSMVEHSGAAPRPPSPDAVTEAAARLETVANRTPVLTSRTLDERVGARVFLKCENFQRSGSFKFRGAYNALASLSPAERDRGVLTYSSGNHGQAVALAGRLLGVTTTVVMPDDAPAAKRSATEAYGAEIVAYDPAATTREEIALRIAGERGATLVPPFDYPAVIAGQGTAALEMLADVGPLDLVIAPCGGGGLLSGTALAASAYGSRVIGVEPSLADDAARTFASGTLHTVRNPPTIADGLRTPSLGVLTWPIIRDRVADIVTVGDEQIVAAMRFLWTWAKLVVEPSGATALAGLLNAVEVTPGSRVGVIVSGGNVDLRTACDLLLGDLGPAEPDRDRS